MKIVCDSCATKYSISDDKVRGKVFKIRCKKCSHIIVVRGTNDAAAAAPAAGGGADAGGWHLVVDGEQVGPLPEAEIRARLARNEINGETYIWKEGLTDWLKLSTVPEFADAVSAPPAGEASGAVAATSDLFTDGLSMGGPTPMTVQVDDGLIQASIPARVGGGGLFGAVDAAANGSSGRVAVRASAAAVEENDMFGAPAASRGGGDLFASHAAAQPVSSDDGRRGAGAAHHDGGRVENLTAQRHENSVLFSLANLQQLAMPTSSAKPVSATSNGSSTQSEGSGLIDIRAMAATTMGMPSEARGGGGGGGSLGDDLPTFGSFSAAAPVLLPMPSQSGPPKWLYIVIGGMAVLLLGIGFMAYKLFTTKPVIEQVQVQVPAPAPVAPVAPTRVAVATPPAATTPPSTIPDDKLPPREGAPDPAAVAAADSAKAAKAAARKAGKGAGGKDKKGVAAGDTGTGKTAAAAPAAEPEAPPKKAGPAKGSLDDLLEGALSGKQRARSRSSSPSSSDDDLPAPTRKGSSASAAAEPAAAGPLAKSAVVSGMNGIKGKINDCYQQFKVPGMAMVNVVIGKSGKVGTATVSGKFAGTPTGLCVEKAVKSASFPPSEGLTTPYPFQLK
jgi:predicted Zn finger-like uncharacterized protein